VSCLYRLKAFSRFRKSGTRPVAPSSHHAEQPVPSVRETDWVARLISADARDSGRMIPGSLPITEPGLRRVLRHLIEFNEAGAGSIRRDI
jgi:hypothetical protein